MIKFLLPLLLAACIAPSEPDIASFRERTVKVEVACSWLGNGWGSAVFVRQEGRFAVFATAKHVLEDEGMPCVYTVQGHPVVQWKLSTAHDLGLFMLDLTWGQWPLEESFADLGEDIWEIGYPVDPIHDVGEETVTRGLLASRLPSGKIRVTSESFFGNSGGPIFDKDGKLVGILVQGVPGLDGWAWAEPASNVFALLSE